jgi:uncharacterized RDD family membrane protein YckC
MTRLPWGVDDDQVPEPESKSTETPSATPPSQEDLLGRRIGAALIDLALLVAVFAILAATIGESKVEEGGFSFNLYGAEAALYFVLVVLYYFALEAAIGQTVGKLLLGLRVVRSDGSRPSVAAISVRTLIRVVDWLPVLYLVGFIAMLATGLRRQRLGDLAARTSVARALPVRHRSLAAAAVAVVVLVLLGLSFYRATGDDDVAGPKAEPATTAETLAVREAEILFQDDFSDPSSGWDTGVLTEGEFGYAEGSYRIFAKQAGRQLRSDIAGPRVEALRLEFEATQLAGASGDLVGARCYTDVEASVGYLLGIAPVQRGYAISAFRRSDYTLLESSGEEVDSIRPLGEENQLRLDCVASPDGPTVLTLAVNGQALVRAEDEKGRRGFDAFGFFVDTTEGGADAHFDDLVVTELVPK